jgi:hypothetical protein
MSAARSMAPVSLPPLLSCLRSTVEKMARRWCRPPAPGPVPGSERPPWPPGGSPPRSPWESAAPGRPQSAPAHSIPLRHAAASAAGAEPACQPTRACASSCFPRRTYRLPTVQRPDVVLLRARGVLVRCSLSGKAGLTVGWLYIPPGRVQR